MFTFIISLIFFAVALAGFAAIVFGRSRDAKGGGGLLLIVGLVMGGVLFTAACYSKVETNNVGIETEFSKPTGRTTGAGVQWTAPWRTVDSWDATGQSYDHSTEKSCVSVRIAGGGTGCVEVQVEWRAAVPRSPENWATYRAKKDSDADKAFAAFTDRRINKQITASLASMFSTFDPLGTVSTETGLAPAPDLNNLYRQKLIDEINLNVGGGTKVGDKVTVQLDNPNTPQREDDPEADIVVRSVSFGFIHYDDQTNAKLTSYGQKLLDARNLRVDGENASKRAAIARSSGVPAAVQQCLDLVRTQLDKGQVSQPGLCMANGTQVILPAK